MGMTIHYRGSIDPNRISELIRDMKSLAMIQGWGYTVFRNGEVGEKYEPSSRSEERENETDIEEVENPSSRKIDGIIPLSGIILKPHPESESISLLFDPVGDLMCLMTYICIRDGLYKKEHAWASTKTQFAPVEIHILVVELLKHLGQKYLRALEVSDEGNYYETGDIRELCALRAKTDRALQILADALEQHMPPNELDPESVEDIADVVERIVREFQERLEDENASS